MNVPDFSQTTLEAAQANTRASNQLQVDTVNASRIEEYEVQWKKYVQSRDERPDATNLIMPVPARAEAVYTDARGWPYIDASDKPVIAPHQYVPATKTPSASIFGTGHDQGAAVEPFPGAELYKPLSLPSGRVFQRIA